MAVRSRMTLQHWRWLIVAMIALSTIAFEVIEHRPTRIADLNGDFLREVLVFGVAFPLAIVVTLGRLTHNTVKQVHASSYRIATSHGLATGVRRVFVVENKTILGAGIENLLVTETDLQVVGMMPKDEVTLLEEIRRARPDVVVLDEATTDASRLCSLLEDFPELRVVVVSAAHDMVRTVEQRQATVTRGSELVTLIKG